MVSRARKPRRREPAPKAVPARTGEDYRSRAVWVLALALVGFTLLLYLPTLGFTFLIVDDDEIVTRNDGVRAGLSLAGIRYAFSSFNFHIWMPLTTLTHQFDWTLFQNGASGHHFHSVAWHAATVGLLFLVLWEITGRIPESLLAAALFACHPTRSGAVAWVASRKELVCGFFYLLSVWWYLRWVRRPGPRSWLYCTAAGVAAMMGKPMAVTLPAALLLLDGLVLRRAGDWRRWPGLVLEKLPLVVMAGVVSVVAWYGQEAEGRQWYPVPPFDFRVQNAFYSVARYLWHTVWPVGLVYHYPELRLTLRPWHALLGVAVIAGVTLVLYWRARRWKDAMPLAGWLWFLLTLTPVLGIIGFANAAMADRYLYIPHMGLLAAMTCLLARLFGVPAGKDPVPEDVPLKQHLRAVFWPEASRTRWFVVAGALLLTATAVAGVVETLPWRDDEKLNERAIAVTPGGNAMAEVNLAQVRTAQGRYDEAIALFQSAVEREPFNVFWRYNMAWGLNEAGRYADALRYIDTRMADIADTHFVLQLRANVCARLGDKRCEVDSLEKLARYKPDDAANWARIAQLKDELGDRSGAIEALEKAVSLRADKNPRMRDMAELLRRLREGELPGGQPGNGPSSSDIEGWAERESRRLGGTPESYGETPPLKP